MTDDLKPDDRLLWPIKDAAEALGVSDRWLRQLIADGKLETVLLGTRRMIRADEIRRLADEGL